MASSIKRALRRNSVLRGMVRVVDLSCARGVSYPASRPNKSDWEKISEDWGMVGKDISNAIDRYKKENANVGEK